MRRHELPTGIPNIRYVNYVGRAAGGRIERQDNAPVDSLVEIGQTKEQQPTKSMRQQGKVCDSAQRLPPEGTSCSRYSCDNTLRKYSYYEINKGSHVLTSTM
jgi:hypothetical protein